MISTFGCLLILLTFDGQLCEINEVVNHETVIWSRNITETMKTYAPQKVKLKFANTTTISIHTIDNNIKPTALSVYKGNISNTVGGLECQKWSGFV